MSNIEYLINEAKYLRHAMELCRNEIAPYPTPEFPVGNCKFASLLLAYHYFQLVDDIEIVMVSGFSDNMVSHVWLEIGGYVFDVTGDQYNTIDDYHLNPTVIAARPYPVIHVEEVKVSYLYRLFGKLEYLSLDRGFSAFKARFVAKMGSSHEYLIAIKPEV